MIINIVKDLFFVLKKPRITAEGVMMRTYISIEETIHRTTSTSRNNEITVVNLS